MSNTAPRGLRGFPRAIAVLLGTIILVGCGAGGGAPAASDPPPASQQADATRGALEFSLVFPTAKRAAAAVAPARGVLPGSGFDGSIPIGSHSVKITLTNPTTGAAVSSERIVDASTRPDGVAGTITVGFPLLPVGPVKIDVTAFPAPGAAGNPLAMGSGTATIVANQTTPATVLMALTIQSLTVTPPTQILHTLQQPFQTGMVDAQATDAQGRPLVYPLEYTSSNPTIAGVTAVSADFMHATITPQISVEGQKGVPVTITVTEPNSGITGSVQVVLVP